MPFSEPCCAEVSIATSGVGGATWMVATSGVDVAPPSSAVTATW
jgi:hypothetical protein